MKKCKECNTEFKPYHRQTQIFCSKVCMEKDRNKTSSQYRSLNGNWNRYLKRLIDRKARRDVLSLDDLLFKFKEQDGKCALSGVKLTCTLEAGKRNWTNASLDRINPGGTYSIENIRLVCSFLNTFRLNISDEDFINWCKRVVDYNGFKSQKK